MYRVRHVIEQDLHRSVQPVKQPGPAEPEDPYPPGNPPALLEMRPGLAESPHHLRPISIVTDQADGPVTAQGLDLNGGICGALQSVQVP